jgi:hypothetical protein
MIRVVLAACLAAAPATAVAKDDPNTLTHGMVQMTIKVGVTTQADIIETFGGPNVTTLDGSGNEMWVYDRHATISYTKEGGFSVGLLGGGGSGGGGAVGGLGFGSRKSKTSESSRSMTLIIKFNSQKIVSDFQSRSSSF